MKISLDIFHRVLFLTDTYSELDKLSPHYLYHKLNVLFHHYELLLKSHVDIHIFYRDLT